MNKLVVHTDGGSRNNPGPSGIGVVFSDEKGKVLETHKGYIGEATNNVAEYRALVEALRIMKKFDAKDIEIRLDSELVVKQMRGEYKVKEPALKELNIKAKELAFFKGIIFKHIPREKNKLADKLVNEAIDEAGF
jgi:ribonuclease HI